MSLERRETSNTDDRKIIEKKFTALGHKPEDVTCDHKHWNFELHGRYCACGTIMVDFGD